MLVLASPTPFSFFNGRKSTWCRPHAFPASAEAKGCAPIPSRPLGQPRDRHPIHQIAVAGEGSSSADVIDCHLPPHRDPRLVAAKEARPAVSVASVAVRPSANMTVSATLLFTLATIFHGRRLSQPFAVVPTIFVGGARVRGLPSQWQPCPSSCRRQRPSQEDVGPAEE